MKQERQGKKDEMLQGENFLALETRRAFPLIDTPGQT